MVRAKLRVDSKTEHSVRSLNVATGVSEAKVMVTVKMGPVYGLGALQGELAFNNISPEAAANFQLGKEYFLDISPAE